MKETKETTLKVKAIKERNNQIVKAYKEGYSKQLIAKVFGLSQPAVYGGIKRCKV